MTTTTLLGATDEIRLARTIEAGLLASELIGRADFAVATAGELVQVERAGREAWQQFLLANVRLVQSIATRAARHSDAPVEDLFQEGFLGLVEAVQRWDCRAGYRFSTYATPWIKRRVQNAAVASVQCGPESVRTQQRAKRVRSLADELGAELRRTATDDELADLFGRSSGWVTRMRALRSHLPLPAELAAEQPIHAEEHFELAKLLRSLPWPENEVVRRRFGFDGEPPLRQRTVAQELGLSLSTLRRYEARALRRLRGWLQHDLAA
ncbi:sigma-70 family RNA polymerase sigma factor [Micropruina sp.]|uniref:sigma-70 family RNA polymerase sigma factor n=1 Tax=Micropruina sp. TaxID=2737536 RepID=UPI0039E58523